MSQRLVNIVFNLFWNSQIRWIYKIKSSVYKYSMACKCMYNGASYLSGNNCLKKTSKIRMIQRPAKYS